jgi:hypothetical protein
LPPVDTRAGDPTLRHHANARDRDLLEIEVPASDVPEALTDVACKLAYFVDAAVVAVRRDSPEAFQIALAPGDPARSQAVTRDVRTLLEHLTRGYRPMRLARLFGGDTEPETASAGSADLTERLVERGFARLHEAGLWALRPPFLGVMEGIDELLQKAARDSYGAPAHAFPALIATETLRRAGYLSFRQNVSSVSHVSHDVELAPAQHSSAPAGRGTPPVSEPAQAAECLPPAVCYHRFRDLADVTLPAGSTITARGTCFRYEGRHNVLVLTRLWSFQVREIIYAGDDEYVRGMAERGPGVLASLLARLGLAGTCESATDPFFVNVLGPLRYAQVASDLRFELRLPLGGGESLVAASLNQHQDHFGKAFAIRLPDGMPASSGCASFELERLALGFFARHGLDEEHWPDAVASRARQTVGAG